MSVKDEKLLTPRQVASALQVSPRTVVRWCREGKISGKKIGRLWRIPPDDQFIHLRLAKRWPL